MEPSPSEPPPPLARSAPSPRVTNGVDWRTLLVLGMPALIFALYVIVKIVGALGADDY